MNVRPLVRAVGAASLCIPAVVAAATWSGYVIDKSTSLPVVRASVSMANAPTVLTDNRGAFHLSTIPVSIPERPVASGWDPSRRVLSLWLEQPKDLRLEVRTLSGRLVARPFDGIAPAGKWTWDASSLPEGRGIRIVTLRHDGRSESWTILPHGLGATTRTTGFAARTAAGGDSISVAAAGFFPAKVPAPAANSGPDTVWLDPNPAGGYIVWNNKVRYGLFVDPRDGRHYRTIAWKDRIWMAQNLNHVPPTADSGSCYNGSKDFCEKFGRHYTWKEATGGASIVRGAYARQGHLQGICPEGWFLLGNLDWARFGDLDPSTQGWRLKSTTGWTGAGNGRDTLGLRLLPSGWRSAAGTFANAGTGAFLWQGDLAQDGSRDGRLITATDSFVSKVSVADEKALSVRCARGPMDTTLSLLSVQPNQSNPKFPSFIDKMGPVRSGVYTYSDTLDATLGTALIGVKAHDSLGAKVWINGVEGKPLGGTLAPAGMSGAAVNLGEPGTSTPVRVVVRALDGDSLVYRVDVHRPVDPAPVLVPFPSGITYGTLVDSRDMATYRTILLASGARWMAENLRYAPGGTGDSSRCMADSPDSCGHYGRLYTQMQALGGLAPGQTVPVRGACPEGWHLPTMQDWEGLFLHALGKEEAGGQLKSEVGWGVVGAGRDRRGFRALAGGWVKNGQFVDSGIEGQWWTSSASYQGLAVKVAMSRYSDAAILDVAPLADSSLLSVRCVEDL